MSKVQKSYFKVIFESFTKILYKHTFNICNNILNDGMYNNCIVMIYWWYAAYDMTFEVQQWKIISVESFYTE